MSTTHLRDAKAQKQRSWHTFTQAFTLCSPQHCIAACSPAQSVHFCTWLPLIGQLHTQHPPTCALALIRKQVAAWRMCVADRRLVSFIIIINGTLVDKCQACNNHSISRNHGAHILNINETKSRSELKFNPESCAALLRPAGFKAAEGKEGVLCTEECSWGVPFKDEPPWKPW